MSLEAVRALEQSVEKGLDADDVLRTVVAALVQEPGVSWAAIAFVEEGELRVGPVAGTADEAWRTRVPVLFHGALVAEIWVDGEIDPGQLERVAVLVAPYALIGWDTGGQAWEP
jgi:hypothetical protein